MTLRLSRRTFLGAAATLAAGGVLRPARAATTPPRLLTAGRRILEVGGRAAPVFGITRADGGAGVVLEPGERFAVTLANRCGAPTIVHWHGQEPPPAEDGVAETGYVAPLADGEERGYDFAARPGTHWMHSHQGLQEQSLMAAPLVVRGADDAALDAQEVVVLLHDFTFRDPAEVLAELTGGMAMAGMSGMAMGQDSGQASGMTHGMDHQNMGHQGMTHGMGQDMGQGAGQGMGHGMQHGGGGPDLNDISFDAYLANDRTLADPQVVRTERGGRVRLRLINGAAATNFWIDLGGLSATVLAVDGTAVLPVTGTRFPLAIAQRLDLLVTLPDAGAFPILAQREGDRARTGIVLATPGAAVGRIADGADAVAAAVDLSLEERLVAATPLAPRDPDVRHRVRLTGSMMPYRWTIDDLSWTDRRPLTVAAGQRAVLDIVNETGMAHPMHLHGHHFQVVAIDGRPVRGAIRDTAYVMPRGSVTVAFDADNPGRWLFHCHNLYHMATGMMTELVYAGG